MSRRHIRLRMKDGSGPGKITDVARDGSPVVRHTRPLRKKGASSGRIVTGVYMANLRGYGFARPVDENWKDGDIYISRDCTNGAWDRDTVEVRLLPKVHGRKQSGTVTRILSRGVNEVIGTAERDGHVMLVIPDDLKLNRTVLIPDEARNGAKDGDKVLAEITDYGRGRHANPVGAVREVFGPADAPGVDIFAIARGENLPMEFSEKQLRQAERCPDHVLDSDFEGRRDLRDWQLVTIDGPDAKDLDDAVSLTEHPDGYTLGVHIADVSNYVQESSQLDREALRRGTSVYLADRVIPMLPEALSNGICSLNAGEDRLALSVIMELDRGGRVTAHEIVESVIRVGERMSYPDVLCRRYGNYVPLFRRMETVSGLIRKRRMKRGAIDFDFPEAKIELDEKGIPTAILPENATVATRIIEDFMLTANETVAAEYRKRSLPFLYRVHGEPDPDKVEELIAFVRKNGVEIDKKKQKITPREIQQALLRIKGYPPDDAAGMLRCDAEGTFRTGGKRLLPLYFADPPVSGSSDPPDHPGRSARTSERQEDRPLSGNPSGCGPADVDDRAACPERRAGDGEAEEMPVHAEPYRGDLRRRDLGRDRLGTLCGASEYGGRACFRFWNVR